MGFRDAMSTKGLYLAEVLRREQLTPHMVRITVGGEDLQNLPARGYDQWFRLFLPVSEAQDADFGSLPESFGWSGYIRYLTTKSGTRPAYRAYTVRALRPAVGESSIGELDIDFVAHGDDGIAGPWAQRAEPGEQVALIDQGRGFDPLPDADFVLLAADESGLPAVAGILRDLPADAKGLAIIEIPAEADRQELPAPAGFELRWLPRADAHHRPGVLALEAVQAFSPERPATLQAYIVGEQALPAGARRHLVAAGVPKARIAFVGYWRVGRAG